MSNEISKFNFEINSLSEAMEYAKLIANSDLAPKDYKGKPGNVLIAMQYGLEIGLKPMQAIQNIAIINGRPAIWGDAMIGLVQSHPLCEYINEEYKNDVAYCTVKRQGEDEYTYEFSKQDAKSAGLLGKSGPWAQYPQRMLQMRARAFALRDKFSDILKGIACREEVEDYQVIEDKKTKTERASERLKVILDNNKPAYDLSQLTKSINNCTNLEELEVTFKNAYKIARENKNHLNVLTELKDKIKSELSTKIEHQVVEHDQNTGELNASSSVDDNGWSEFKEDKL